jgi:hypothetical protein
MKKILAGLLLAMPVLAQAQAVMSGEAAVRALGRLNGEALACKQMALVDRVRISIVHEAPKTREIGEIFEAATTERFLELGQNQTACADGRSLAQQIDAAIGLLRAAYGGQK